VTVRAEDVGRGVFTTRETTTVIRRRVIVRGHVQGVFFRETTRRRAQTAGVSGWARNLPDGSVEAVFEGERDAVERLVEFAREGPRGARVDWVDVVSEEPEGLEGFSVA
jgi:acylphosphatase